MTNGFSIQYPRTIHDPDNEPGNVVLTIRIESRHLRGFAADQSTAGFLARTSNPFHDGDDYIRIELSGCDVIHEEERPGSLHQNVVDAVIHQVAANRIVTIHHDRHLQLCA